MIVFLETLLASWLMLHPGHSTRVEVQWNADEQSVELAMRIDHTDLESALRKRLGRSVVIENLTEEQAEKWVGAYLRETLRLDGEEISTEQFSWVGWERKRVSSWIYAELCSTDHRSDTIALKILSLLEVEPELNHVVTIRRGQRQESVVLSKEKSVVIISTKPEPLR